MILGGPAHRAPCAPGYRNVGRSRESYQIKVLAEEVAELYSAVRNGAFLPMDEATFEGSGVLCDQ